MVVGPNEQERKAARQAQWRAARLAALSLVIGRLGHDVRGALQAGLLMAERLRGSTDPLAVRVCDSVGRSVDRATDLLRETVTFVREGPVALARETVVLAEALRAAQQGAWGSATAPRLEAALPAGLDVAADPPSTVQVLRELLANAAAAGARCVVVSAERAGRAAAILIADDGPGLPPAVAERPFLPGTAPGGGWGLAIAHDLAIAQGGDLVLLKTGPEGTRFRLTLPLAVERLG